MPSTGPSRERLLRLGMAVTALVALLLVVYALYLGFQLAGSSRALIDPPYGQRFGVPAGGAFLFAVVALILARRRVAVWCGAVAVLLLVSALVFLLAGR